MTLASLLDVRLADGREPPTEAPGQLLTLFTPLSITVLHGRRALRSALTAYLKTAATEEDLDAALAPLVSGGFIQRHDAWVPQYMEPPFDDLPRIRVPIPDEPEDGEPYYTPTVEGVRAGLVCAGLRNPSGLVPGWVLGEERLMDQVVLSVGRRRRLEDIELECCCSLAERVRDAVATATARKLIEVHDDGYRLTIDGEVRHKELKDEACAICFRFQFPNLSGESVPPSLQLRPERKLALLTALAERELCLDVLMPLLRAMGFSDVQYKNGPQERGKDIVGWKADELGHPSWLAVVAKACDISGAAQGNNSILTVANQIEQALDDPIDLAPAADAIRMHRCWVMTSGHLRGDAMSKVTERLRRSGMSRVVRWVEGDRLTRLVDQWAPGIWTTLMGGTDV